MVERIKKVVKFCFFIIVVGFGVALILVLLGVGIIVSPLILIGYCFRTYMEYKADKNKIRAKLEYKIKTQYSIN